MVSQLLLAVTNFLTTPRITGMGSSLLGRISIFPIIQCVDKNLMYHIYTSGFSWIRNVKRNFPSSSHG